jgi:hypothetical protein
VLPASLNLTVNRGDVLVSLISNSTPNQGPMQWTLTADTANPATPPVSTTNRVLPALLPGGQGGQPAAADFLGAPLPSFPPFGSTNFRWNTNIAQNTNTTQNPMMLPAQPWTPGTYKWTVRATNDWGQVSNDMLLTVNLLLPQPDDFGDYNHNGTVDAADYVVWRKTDLSPTGYQTWRANFGKVVPIPATGTGYATVPEPTVLLLFSIGAAWLSSVASVRCRT